METNIYNKKSQYYDYIYSWKDYESEAAILKQIIHNFKMSPGNELLDAGCGTGTHLQYLQNDFSVMGIDISDGILKEAKLKNPQIQFKQCDFIHVNFAKKYDVILCLGYAIAYTKNHHNLQKTIKSFAKLLNPGGVLVIEPWFQQESYQDNSALIKTYQSNELHIARMTDFRKKGIISIVNSHYLVSEKGKSVQHWEELHELAMFEKSEYLQLMSENGLDSEYYEHGLISTPPSSWYESDRGLLIGVKQY